MSLNPTLLSIFLFALSLLSGRAQAAMDPVEIQHSCNSLATSTFVLKDLILLMDSTSNSGPMIDVCNEFGALFDNVVANIGFVTGSVPMLQLADQQIAYEGYSNFVQSLVELMDAVTQGAQTLIDDDDDNELRIQAEIRALSGVVDAYFYNIISLFPKNTAYRAMASTQKGHVDRHFRRALHSFHLLPDKYPESDKDKKPFDPEKGKKPSNPGNDKKPSDPDNDKKPSDPDNDKKPSNPDNDKQPSNPDKDRKPLDPEKDKKPSDPNDKKPFDPDKDKKSPDSGNDEESPDSDENDKFPNHHIDDRMRMRNFMIQT
ncbi:hypothetical protein VTN00DRAFT_3617 [Thermoascus crustaceus]|uniref:uncharacterized protein n=1 Tax=Thermoascus crustaceus TaxID=5088 RepID=UPI0037434F95